MSVARVAIKPALLKWAIQRSGKGHAVVADRFGKLNERLSGSIDPTYKQIEAFAKYTYTPVGSLFLDTPPEDTLTLPDFRVPANSEPTQVSANLLDVIANCEIRQDWYRNYLIRIGETRLNFVGQASLEDSEVDVAARIRDIISFDSSKRAELSTWEAALSDMVKGAEAAGILVMRNGIVGSNTRRLLDNSEFSGFALVDDYSPLVFINGKDSRSRQMFTLAHELAHIWLGESGLSLNTMHKPLHRKIERWCDSVAAEVLVPMKEMKSIFGETADFEDEVWRLSKHFKVSSLVVLRRLRDAEYLEVDEFSERFSSELDRIRNLSEKRSSGGGDYYRTQISRTGRQFTMAVVSSTLEGQTLYRDAFTMLGVKKQATFNELARSIGVMV